MAKHARVRRGRRTLRRSALLLAGTTVPLGWLLVAPAQGATVTGSAHAANASSKTVTVADAAEAWYAGSPVDLCTTPLGCPPQDVPTSPYPADTLHVGVAGGQETARTYLKPDTLAVPFGAEVLSATMTLPVATGQNDGTQAPDAAALVACLATEPFTDGAQGSSAAPPKTDCSTSVKASYDAKKNVFTLDATAFLTAWADGTVANGIALVPDPKAAQPTDAWHVAFNGRKRADADHISTEITFTPPAPVDYGDTTTDTQSDSAPPVSSRPVAPPPVASVPLPDSSTAAAGPPDTSPVVAPQQAPVAAPAQQPVALSTEFQYPLAFLLPLALLAGAVFFARLFTRDATPMRAR
jgi:hypothetical protein